MAAAEQNIMLWLPSPIGDAVLCTPALRAVRRGFKRSNITFLATEPVRRMLSPCGLCDRWIDWKGSGITAIASELRSRNFSIALLLKNSLGSAAAVFLAGIPQRVGYARDGRSILLTDRLRPPKSSAFRYKPVSMVNYYMAAVSYLGCEGDGLGPELAVDSAADASLSAVLPGIFKKTGPLVILVASGAFGPSKCWPAERFAALADLLAETHKATVVICVSQHPLERAAAARIRQKARFDHISLAERPLDTGQLTALIGRADLVVSNDTGPRHIAIATGRRVITLFGPNDPLWTETGYENEIQITGQAPCGPCARPVCRKKRHWCMESIAVDVVAGAADAMLRSDGTPSARLIGQQFVEASSGFFVDRRYRRPLAEVGLNCLDEAASFGGGENLTKDGLPSFRSRSRFQAGDPKVTFYLKRYVDTAAPLPRRLAEALRLCRDMGQREAMVIRRLKAAGVNVPKVVCYGGEHRFLLAQKSFVITEGIARAHSLESRLPDCLSRRARSRNTAGRREFIRKLAQFIKDFHDTGFRHRDLYFSHIFVNDRGEFFLIDLARAFRPVIFTRRWTAKDLAQLCYSAPASNFSLSDRLRFYKYYRRRRRLEPGDRALIRRVVRKTRKMAGHDIRRGLPPGFSFE